MASSFSPYSPERLPPKSQKATLDGTHKQIAAASTSVGRSSLPTVPSAALLLSATTSSPATPSATDAFAGSDEDDVDGLLQARPRRRGVARRRITSPKRKRADHGAVDDFVVPDDEEEMPLSKQIKRVAANKLAKATSPESQPKASQKPPATTTLDRAQKAEELRFRKKKALGKFEQVVNKQDNLRRAPTINSAADQEIKSRTWKRVTVLPPALSSGRVLDSELVLHKTPFEIQNLHRKNIKETAGSTQARVETDPNDPQIKIVHLAKYTKQVPAFPNVYTDLRKIIAAPHAYPQVELDMEAGEYGVLRLRWFKAGVSDPDYRELARDALARHKDSVRSSRKK